MNGAQPRVSSPAPGSSILMTSAPMSPSSIVQKGPASTRVRSMTFSPSRAGMRVYQKPSATSSSGFTPYVWVSGIVNSVTRGALGNVEGRQHVRVLFTDSIKVLRVVVEAVHGIGAQQRESDPRRQVVPE